MNQIYSKPITINPTSIVSEGRDFRGIVKNRHSFQQIGVFKFLFLLFFAFYVPSALIWLGIIPFEYRFHAFSCVLVGLISFCLLRRYSFHELGFRTDNLYSSLRWNLLFCAVGAVGLYMTYKAGFLRPRTPNYLPSIYVIYIFFLGPIQEVVFRGFLFAEMKRVRIFDKRWVLLASTLSFCFLHIIYRHPPLLIIAIVSGLAWGIIFIKRPNIWGISLSHSLLGALAMFLGVI